MVRSARESAAAAVYARGKGRSRDRGERARSVEEATGGPGGTARFWLGKRVGGRAGNGEVGRVSLSLVSPGDRPVSLPLAAFSRSAVYSAVNGQAWSTDPRMACSCLLTPPPPSVRSSVRPSVAPSLRSLSPSDTPAPYPVLSLGCAAFSRRRVLSLRATLHALREKEKLGRGRARESRGG